MSNHYSICYRGCCTEWEQEILLFLDHELHSEGCQRIQRHMDHCEECARFYRILEREEQLLGGRLRHQVEMVADPDDIADLVMSDIPAFQPVTWQQRIWEYVRDAFTYVWDQDRRHYAIAASIMICVMGILLSLRAGDIPEERYFHILRWGKYVRVNPTEPILISMNDGEFIELPDGSLIYATKDTRFCIESYPEKTDGTVSEPVNMNVERRIRLLSGSIYLDVQPHPAKLGFSVITSNAKATVFGTEFFVGTTLGPNKVTVVGVRTGQVMVEKQPGDQLGSRLLSPQDMIKVTSMNGKVSLDPCTMLTDSLRKRLDRFAEARSDRSARRMLPVIEDDTMEDNQQTESVFGENDLLSPSLFRN